MNARNLTKALSGVTSRRRGSLAVMAVVATAATGLAGCAGNSTGDAAVPAAQTISFQQPNNVTFSDSGPFMITPTASSGLPVVVKPTAGSSTVCTLSGGTVILIGAGTCTVNADQSGNASWAPAPTVTRSFTVSSVLSVIAGTGAATASKAGPATSSPLNGPGGVAVDSAGNVYVADTVNNQVEKIAAGQLSVIAGTGTAGPPAPGLATSSPLTGPSGVAVDTAGSVYVADQGNNRVEKVTGGQLSVIAGTVGPGPARQGPATSSPLRYPSGVAVDTAGNVYIADQSNNRVEKVTAGQLSFFAGTGTPGAPKPGAATSSPLDKPSGVAVDSKGNVYVADTMNNRVEKVTGGQLSVIAGTGTAAAPQNGPATNSPLNQPSGVSVDTAGAVYVADTVNNQVEKITGGQLSVFAGTGTAGPAKPGPATSSPLNQPAGVAVDAAGTATIADTGNNTIDRVTAGQAITFPQPPDTAEDIGPVTLTATASSGLPVGYTSTTSSVCTVGDARATLVGAGTCTINADQPGNADWATAPTVTRSFTVTAAGTLAAFAGTGFQGSPAQGPAANSPLSNPFGVAVDGNGNVYVADQGNNRVEKVTAGGQLSVFAGNGTAGPPEAGPATSSPLNGPSGVTVHPDGTVFIADTLNNVVEKVTAGGQLSVFAGTGTTGAPRPGLATSSPLNHPYGVTVNSAAAAVYIADTGNNQVEEVLAGQLAVVAGDGTSGPSKPGPSTGSPLNSPTGVAGGPNGSIYVVDSGNNQVETVTNVGNTWVGGAPPDMQLSVFAGTGAAGAPKSGPATSSPLNQPWGVAMGDGGDVYIADQWNNRVEKVNSTGQLSLFAGTGLQRPPVAGPAMLSPVSLPVGVAVGPNNNVYIVGYGSDECDKVTLATL